MAKKVVATLKKAGGITYARAIKVVKTSSGSYGFEEKIMLKTMCLIFLRPSLIPDPIINRSTSGFFIS